jgi:cobyric acid synthase
MLASSKLGQNLYNIRGKYVHKVYENNKIVFKVYNKFRNNKPKDYSYEVYKLSDLMSMLRFFEENIYFDIFPNVEESDFSQIPQEVKGMFNE